jgi:hypothetical protein
VAILPGGAAPKLPENQPMLAVPPGLGGINQEPYLGLRRVAQLDNASRIASQLEHDRGAYSRPPVGPVEYSEGNIKKSTALTGPAGYNQKAIPIPDSPDDMSQAQYLLSMQQETPQQRMRMQTALAGAKQNFLNTRLAQTEYPVNTHNMMDNLMNIARAKLQKGK